MLRRGGGSGCYHGLRTAAGCVVTRPDGTPLSLAPSLAVRRHSPTGFGWSYGGSGPAQLALALLLDVGVGAAVALDHYQALKAARTALEAAPAGPWILTSWRSGLPGVAAGVLVCPSGEPHDWKPEWVSGDPWHGGTEYRSTCRRCGLQRSRIEGAPHDLDTWDANGTTYYLTGADGAPEAAL